MTLTTKYWLYVAAFALVAIAAVVVAFAAQTPRQAFSAPRLSEISVRPILDMNGALIAFPVKATFQEISAAPSGAVDARTVGSVEFDLRTRNGSVILDGEEYDYREIADILMAVANREWRTVNPEPLPVRRRALRSSGTGK